MREGEFFTSYMWEDLECELCKTSFMDIVKNGNKAIDLLGFELPKNSHYMLLESVNTEEILKKERVKVVHVVNFGNRKVLSIGRGHDCSVRITDISISRLHGFLRVVNDKEIWVEDK